VGYNTVADIVGDFIRLAVVASQKSQNHAKIR